MISEPETMRFGIRMPPCAPVDRVAAAARRAEQHGFDTVWFSDSQLIWRDTYAAMAFAAVATERVQLASGVTNVAARHPSVVASGMRTVAELAPGRVHCGLGAGWSAAVTAGLVPSTTGEMRRAVHALRALVSGGTYDFGSGPVHLRDAGFDVPIHLSALGPKTQALAGEVADGVVLMLSMSPTMASRDLAIVAAGAQRAGRSLRDLTVTVAGHCHVTDDVERDLKLVKPFCAMGLRSTHPDKRAAAGIDFLPPERIEGVYPDLAHAEDWELAVRACDRVVPDEVARAYTEHFCLFGTARDISDRIDALVRCGVGQLLLQPVGGDTNYTFPSRLMESFGEVRAQRRQPRR